MLAQALQPDAALAPGVNGGFRYKDAADNLIEVTLDPTTRLPLRASQIVDGRPSAEIAYSNYKRRHGLMMPGRVQIYQAGTLREDLTLKSTRIGEVAESKFSAPSGYSAPPPAGEPSARELAPGMFLFENMPGNYHSMAIDQGDHLVLLEAPLSPAYAEAQKNILAKLRPGIPVSHVLVTHHHGDHTGGLKFWAEAGATIVAAKGAGVALQRQLKARGLVAPAEAGGGGRPPQLRSRRAPDRRLRLCQQSRRIAPPDAYARAEDPLSRRHVLPAGEGPGASRFPDRAGPGRPYAGIGSGREQLGRCARPRRNYG
jgi:hypothetical protein